MTFVEDNHALTQPSTMELTAKALADFFDVGEEEAKERAGGASEVEGAVEESYPPARQKNIEVKEGVAGVAFSFSRPDFAETVKLNVCQQPFVDASGGSWHVVL